MRKAYIKPWILLVLALCSLCLACTAFFGCYKELIPNAPHAIGDLSAEKVQEIKSVYVEETKAKYSSECYSADLVMITSYYGEYNGHIVFGKRDGNFYYTMALVDIVIDGIYICTNNDGEYNPMVYLDPNQKYDHNRVVTLEKAYDMGYITKSDLKAIASRTNKKV